MPRIDAPTVAEHHEWRRAALLEAATALLADGGVDALTLAAVGPAAGLARSSVYQYFDSAPALLAAVVEDAFPRATTRITDAVSRARDPRAQVDAYVTVALEVATDPTHRSLATLARSSLPEPCQARIVELHREQLAPLRDAITALGVDDPALTTRLLAGLVQAAAQAIVDGAPRTRVRRRTLALVHEGLSPAR
jgi:AcrR family transcriptional regulator